MRRGLGVIAFMLVPSAARADVNHLFPTLPRPMGLAGAYAAAADDASALFYNPAGLTEVDGSYISLGFLISAPNLGATKADGTSLNVPSPTDVGYGIHLAWSPRTILDGNLGLGFSLFLPNRKALHIQVHRFDDPYFVLYENSIELLEIRLGLAYKFFDFISVGVSTLLLAGLNGRVQLEAPFQATDMVDPNMRTILALEANLPNREFLSAGVQIFPMKGLRFGATFREATFLPVQLPIDFTIDLLGLSPIRTVANLDVKVKYSPAQLVFGGAWEVTPDLMISADVEYARYSQYQIPYGNVTLDRRFSPDITLLSPRQPIEDLRDLVIPRVGVEYRLLEDLTIRGGYYFFRSFIRSSDAPIFDSDKHGITAGATYSLSRLLMPAGTELNLMAAAQALLFTAKHTVDYDHSGQIISTSFGADFRY